MITFQREEKLNAISTEVERALLDALAGPDVREARCVVFAGGERAFSAGADLKEERDESPGGIDAYYRDTGDVYERIAELPQPTFSAISGWCLGAGFELRSPPTSASRTRRPSSASRRSSSGSSPARAAPTASSRARACAGEGAAPPETAGRRGRGAATGRHRGRPGRTGAGARARARGQVAALPRSPRPPRSRPRDAIAESGREAGVMLERLAYAALAQTDDARAAGEAFGNRKRG